MPKFELPPGNYGNNPWLGSSSPERQGAWGDLEYHRIYNGGVGLPKFQYASGAITWNKRVSGVYANRIVNRYGGYTSDTLEVDNPDSTETIEGVTVTHVAVKYPHTYSIDGDSGGPWWIGASGGAAAVGIHMGSTWISFPDCCHRAVVTPATNLDNIWPSATCYTSP